MIFSILIKASIGWKCPSDNNIHIVLIVLLDLDWNASRRNVENKKSKDLDWNASRRNVENKKSKELFSYITLFLTQTVTCNSIHRSIPIFFGHCCKIIQKSQQGYMTRIKESVASTHFSIYYEKFILSVTHE